MKRRTSLAATLGVVACAILAMTEIGNAGTIDAISAASFQLKGGTTTTSSATFNVYHSQQNGSFRIYWDTKTQTATSGFPATNFVNGDLPNGSSAGGSATITNLLPGTSYFFWIQGYEGDGQTKIVAKAKLTGNFKTDGTAGILAKDILSTSFSGQGVDPLGRRAQNRGPIQINQFGTTIELNEGHR